MMFICIDEFGKIILVLKCKCRNIIKLFNVVKVKIR